MSYVYAGPISEPVSYVRTATGALVRQGGGYEVATGSPYSSPLAYSPARQTYSPARQAYSPARQAYSPSPTQQLYQPSPTRSPTLGHQPISGILETGPAFVEELGRSTWKLLHTMAERYPEVPSFQDQRMAQQFIESLSQLYPCEKCRLHFQENLRQFPPDVSSRAAFVDWAILLHNQVNQQLGKPLWSPAPRSLP
eukprot:EG_transcript_22093